MQAENKQSSNLEAALQKWEAQQQKYIQRYGSDVVNDREYQKVQRDTLSGIHKQFKNTPLSFEDKMELRIQKGRINQMNRMLYPNPIVRVARSAIRVAASPLKAILIDLPANIASYFFNNRPAKGLDILSNPRQQQVQNSLPVQNNLPVQNGLPVGGPDMAPRQMSSVRIPGEETVKKRTHNSTRTVASENSKSQHL
jgi:hypothetical protein